MNLGVALFALSAAVFPSLAAAQTTPPDPNQSQGSSSATPPAAPPADRDVSWRKLFPNILSDQERMWTFPARLAHGEDLLPTIAVLGTVGGLLALDPVEGSYFHKTSTFHSFNNVVTSNATAIGSIVIPASLYAIGLVTKDAKMQSTALLSGEAVADAEILTEVLKVATQRQRPSAFPSHGNYSDSWFEKGTFSGTGGGFPSGHTIAAFSIATVVARKYGNHRWVPYVAYGTAALVGFSRLSQSAHFTSDVFMGGALGYAIGRFSVLQQ